MGLWAWVFARTWSLSLEPQALSLSLELEYEPWVLALILYPIMSHISQKLALVGGGTIGSNSHCNWQKDFNCKGEDTVRNTSFRIFHETQFNAYFIIYNWFHEILVKYVKKDSFMNYHAFFPRLFYQRREQKEFILWGIQMFFYNKWIQNWYSLYDTQLFNRTTQGTGEL